MWTKRLISLSWYISIIGGVLLGCYQLMHPMRDAHSVLHSPYASIHAIGIVAIFLLLFGILGVFLAFGDRFGKTNLFCFLCVFFGTAFVGGLLFVDATLNPIVATLAPQLQTEGHGSGAFHVYFPLLGATAYLFLLGPLLFIIGYIWLSVLILRTKVLPWWISPFFFIGCLFYGPLFLTPLFMETIGGILLGCGFILVGILQLLKGKIAISN